jgi:hypothetical protein
MKSDPAKTVPAIGQRTLIHTGGQLAWLSSSPAVAAPPPPLVGGFEPITPVRILDTRSGPPVPAGGTVTLPVSGEFGVPSDATAVVLNVTATQPAAAGYLTVYPCGTPPPLASNVNYSARDTVPGLVVVEIGVGGSVCVTTFAASHILVDLSGYHHPGGAGFVPSFPSRLVDTRSYPGPVVAGQVLTVQVPDSSVSSRAVAAVFNVTVTDPQEAGFITVYPCDAPRPVASNLNYVAKQTVANLVMVGLGTSHAICLYTLSTTNLIVDLTGSFQAGTGQGFSGTTPTRILDTRTSTHLAAGDIRVVALPGVPDRASGVVVNMTATESQGPGYLTVFPCGESPPDASNVNYPANGTVSNLVAVGVGVGSFICVLSFAAADVVVDLTGFYGPPN